MADAEVETRGGEKKKSLKTPLIVGAIMVVEALAVVGFLMLASPGPQDASASLEGAESAELERTIELPLVEGRYQNMSTNRLWRWDAEIFIKVRKRNEEQVAGVVEHRRAEISAGVNQIFRRAQHNHLKEPELRTLRRQLEALVADVFGTDASGEPRVEEVIIASLNGQPMED